MRPWATVLVMFTACATAKPMPVVEAEPTPKAALAPAGEDDLSAAFGAAEAPRALKGQVPAPLADPRKPFNDAMAAKSTDQARRLADTLTGIERWRAYELTSTQAQGEGEKGEAVLSWYRACGPEKLELCRAAAVAALGRLKSFAAQAAQLKAGDLCVQHAEATQRPAPCFTGLARDDDVNLTRAALVKAISEPAEARRVALLERVVSLCERVQCATPRRKALLALVAIEQSGKHVEAALAHALKEASIGASTLPEPQRAWSRPVRVDQLCAQYDATAGAGACRKLEKQHTGSWSFKDFSLTKSGQPGLSADQVKLVNEHYSPPLKACLDEQARKLIAPDQAEYEVRWVVFNDGRVGEVHLQPDAEVSPLAACLRRQFSLWRYPRFDGEWQNVAQRFTVTASTRVVSEQL